MSYLNHNQDHFQDIWIFLKDIKSQKNEEKLQEWMNSHLLTDLEDFGVWANNYDEFFKKRAKIVSQELKKRIVLQKDDKEGQLALTDDFEELEIE